PANASSATFTARAGTLTTAQSATITASLNGSLASVTIFLGTAGATVVSSIQCSTTSLNVGNAAFCTVQLSGAASASLTVPLSTRRTALIFPSTLHFPPPVSPMNSTALSFSAGSSTTATITTSPNAVSQSVSLTLNASRFSGTGGATISSLQCSATSLNVGNA